MADEVIPDSKPDTGVDEFLSDMNLESEQGPDLRPRDPETGRYLQTEESISTEAPSASDEAPSASEDDDVAPETDSDETEEVEDDPETVIDPPASWTADAKSRWADIPGDLQAVIAEAASTDRGNSHRQANEAVVARETANVEREAAKQERATLAQSLQAVTQYAEAMDPVIQQGMQTDWAALAQEDPDAYTARKAQFDQRTQWLQAMKAEHGRVQAQALSDVTTEQNAKLNLALPNLAEDADKAWQSYMPTLREAGYSDKDVQNFRDSMTDHRQVVLVDKASKYDAIVASRKAIVAKKAAKPAPKVQKPKASEDSAKQETARVAALNKHLDSNPFDPVDALTELFERAG